MSNMIPLIEAGPDAFTNLFDVKITFPEEVMSETSDFQESVSVRIKDFPFPTFTPQPYNVFYKAVSLKRFAPKITGTRKLTLNLRLDAKWDIYRAFKRWKNIYINESSSTIDFSKFIDDKGDLDSYGTIQVVSYKSSTDLSDFEEILSGNELGPSWLFKQVACINVGEPEFTRDTATPLVLPVEFMFGQYVPPNETAPTT